MNKDNAARDLAKDYAVSSGAWDRFGIAAVPCAQET